jgi:hypothetical protein
VKRFYFLIAFLVIVAGGLGYAAGRNWDDNHDDDKVQVVDANGQQTIVVHDHDRGFFPFGILFIPLFFFLIFGLGRAFFWRGRYGGPWQGGPSDRFDEWHRRAHANEGTNPSDSGPPPAAS